MLSGRWVSVPGLLILCVAAAGCLYRTTAPPPPSLALEQHSLRIPLETDEQGVARWREHPPLVGTIDLKPILSAEGMPAEAGNPDNLQLLVHYSRFYLTADGFRSVWEVDPQPGSSTATYRPIPIVVEPSAPPLRGVRLSRFGPAGATCVRVDRSDGETVFINALGETQPICP